MPSKGKKNSKPPSPRTPSPRTPSKRLALSPSDSAGDHSFDHSRLLSALSSAHPSLLPSASSVFSGIIVESVSEASLAEGKGKRAVVYLSKDVFRSSSSPSGFHPGSIVSVSLVPLEAQIDGDDCCMVDDDAGRQFALATLSSSEKVLKNGVRLSWGLSCTMGFPTIGRGVFISPLSTFRKEKCELLHLSPVNEAPNTSAVELVFEEKRVKEVAQILAARWLNCRHLLKGNTVGIPICGKLCIFYVRDSELKGSALWVDGSTRVQLLTDDELLDGDGDGPDEGKSLPEDESDSDFPRLGGLSKEIKELKHIIDLSLFKYEALPSTLRFLYSFHSFSLYFILFFWLLLLI